MSSLFMFVCAVYMCWTGIFTYKLKIDKYLVGTLFLGAAAMFGMGIYYM